MKAAKSLAKRRREQRRSARLIELMGEFLAAERADKTALMQTLGKQLAQYDADEVNACYRKLGRPNAQLPRPHLPEPAPSQGIDAPEPEAAPESIQALVDRLAANGLAPGTPVYGARCIHCAQMVPLLTPIRPPFECDACVVKLAAALEAEPQLAASSPAPAPIHPEVEDLD